MQIYKYNSRLHKFKYVHDETGGRLSELEFKYYPCFCGSNDYEVVSTTTRHNNNFQVVGCKDCGTMRVNPYLTDASVETYYKEIYGPVKRKDISAEKLYNNQSEVSPQLLKIVTPQVAKDAKILDYGSGAGGRMDALKEDGFTNIHLFDFDKKYLDYGISKSFKEHDESNKYDLIILSHVIEHINEPVEFLKEMIAKNLAPNGQIYLEVPMYENTKTMLNDFHLAHKYYFTAKSLPLLAAIAGLKVVAEHKDAIFTTPDADALKNFEQKQMTKILDNQIRKTKLAEFKTKTRLFFKPKKKK